MPAIAIYVQETGQLRRVISDEALSVDYLVANHSISDDEQWGVVTEDSPKEWVAAIEFIKAQQ